MNNEFVFSWAENAAGKMVHVDSVPRGDKCGCVCPNCHEPLLARHGEKNEHGFAHHSKTRGVNLKKCYMVTLYKCAEQIIQQHKKIRVPSYYGIFAEKEITFDNVILDSYYERDDKQPDVIATTADGKQYLIEFMFDDKVQHKQTFDYKNLNCLEIDLSNQNLNSIENFLLNTTTDRKWLNNQTYFDNIELLYKQKNKIVRLKNEQDCISCKIQHKCVPDIQKSYYSPLIIENGGNRYRLCKIEEYEKELALLQKSQINGILDEYGGLTCDKQKTCFICEHNLDCKNEPPYEFANCELYNSIKVPENTPKNTAMTCKHFKIKYNKEI